MQSIRKAREKISQYPYHFVQCGPEAGVYAKCVTVKADLKKDDCAKEFRALRDCMKRSMERKR